MKLFKSSTLFFGGRFTAAVFVLFYILGSCASLDVPRYYPTGDSYLGDGRHYTVAIYSNKNRLLNRPIEQMRHSLDEAEKAGVPYTDIYVIVHGWNFTIPEAVDNYTDYVDYIDSRFRQHPVPPGFKPYIFFIAYDSVSRPLEDMASSILPLGLDVPANYIFEPIDRTVFLLPSAWGESLHPFSVAIGDGRPIDLRKWDYDSFRGEDRIDKGLSPSGYRGAKIPVSVLLRAIFDENFVKSGSAKVIDHNKKNSHGVRIAECDVVDGAFPAGSRIRFKREIDEKKVLCHTFPYQRLIVDHEIAAVENLVGTESKLFLQLDADLHLDDEIKDCAEIKNGDDLEAYAVRRNPFQVHCIGHSYGGKLITLAAIEAIVAWEGLHDTKKRRLPPRPPIESLIVFNPAFQPEEIEYRDVDEDEIVDAMKEIPRKGIVYTNWDYATGLHFDVSEILINRTVLQQMHENSTRAHRGRMWKWTNLIIRPVSGVISIGTVLVYSPVSWVCKKVINLPSDFYHHVKSNDTFGSSEKEEVAWYWWPFNAVHFFLPVEQLFWPGRDPDGGGIVRAVRPGLGRTGLYKRAKGRLWKDLAVFETFVDETTEVNEKSFVNMASPRESPPFPGADPFPGWADDKVYSFDASLIYDTWWKPEGAHSDLRRKDEVDEDWSGENEKRDYTFNFILRATKDY